MKGTEILELSPEEAKEEYKKYVEAVKTRKEKYLEDLKKVYHSLKNGRKVIDVFESFKKAGVNDEGEPKLGICQADAGTAYFIKSNQGSGRFSKDSYKWDSTVADVTLPSETWENWERKKTKLADGSIHEGNFKREVIRTAIPIIPGHLLPDGKLSNYYLLWEVKDWAEHKAPLPKNDPFLLRRISPNLFSVLAEWELTDIERAVIRGRSEQ